MSMNNTNNNNPYGHLLDKYLDSNHVDYKTREQREEEAKSRYGNLLDYAKPDHSALELMAKMEDERMERHKKMEAEQEQSEIRRQERIEAERYKEEMHNAEVRGYAESILERKQAKIKAEEMEREERRKAEEKQQEMYATIDGLRRISPESADAYIQALKMGNVI